jgi:hypothetical protein
MSGGSHKDYVGDLQTPLSRRPMPTGQACWMRLGPMGSRLGRSQATDARRPLSVCRRQWRTGAKHVGSGDDIYLYLPL